MPNKNGVVGIGLSIDYQKSLQEMVNDFKSKLTVIANEAKKVEFSKDINAQIADVNKRIDGIAESFDKTFKEINDKKIDSSNFEKYQTEITKKFEKINGSITEVTTKITGLEEKLGMLNGSDFATNMKKQFDELSQSVLGTYKGLEKVLDLTRMSSSGALDKNAASSVERYSKTLNDIKRIRQEINDIENNTVNGNMDDVADTIFSKGDLLDRQVEAYRRLNLEIKNTSKSSPEYEKKENQLVRIQIAIEKTIAVMRKLNEVYEDSTGDSLLDNREMELFNVANGFGKGIDSFVSKAEKMREEVKGAEDTVKQIQGTFNTFQIKDGAIHVPIDIATKNNEFRQSVQKIIDDANDYFKNKPIVAKVKLTLDSGTAKGYKKNADIDKQSAEGQNEPAIDISNAMKTTYRDAVREAETMAKNSIKAIQEIFRESPIKIKPDKDAFANDLAKMVNSSLEKISKEGLNLNINDELSKLVDSLKEASTSLTGGEGFKLGLDEASINRITDAIENMAHMFQRVYKVASDNDIAAQWTAIESKFKSVAGEEGKLLKGNKEHKVAIQELAIEYKKYLDMGGQNDLSALTNHKQTVKNITQEYENLGKAVQETANKQEKQSSATKASKETSDAIKSTTRVNKTLETQADKTSIAIKNEGKSAETAAGKFRKLAKEKGTAVVANRELAKAAKETADALEREAKARKSGAGKTNKNAIDEGVYSSNALKWQRDIKQSLLDSGNYEEVYGSKISQAANGVVKFTAYVRDANDEWKKLTATVNSSGGISSPQLTDASEKEILKIEKMKEALREYYDALNADPTEPTFFNRTELEEYVSKIIEAAQALETLNTKYKVALKSDGSLSITKEIKEANGTVKTFTANFDSVDSVIDETTGSVKDLAKALKDAFDNGKFTTSVKDVTSDFATKARDAFNSFKLKHQGDSNFAEINADLLKLESTIDSIGNKEGLNKFKQDLSDLGVRLKNIKADANLGTLFEGQTKPFGDINEVRNSLDSLLGTMGKVNEKSIRIKDMKTLTAEIQQADGTIRKMTISLDSANFARFVDNGISEFTRLEKNAKKILGGIRSLVRIYLSPQDFVRYFRRGLDKVKEIDTAMTELRKVSDASPSELASYFDDAVESAKELGSSVKDMISATADWARMGYNLPDSKKLGELAVLYKNVGDGISIEEASSSLTSTLQGFQIDPKEANKIIDSFNEVSNNFAIESGGIGEALKRSAAAFHAANTDLNQAIALIATGNEITQSPERIGTMWQTVSARIRGTKTELEELGESTDDVLSTSKLRELVKGYTDVDIMLDKNTYKDIYTIISEIGEKWKDLKDVERAALLEGLAGKKQSNILAAVLNNVDRLEEVYNTAESSAGSAMREQEKYTLSLQYSLDQLTAYAEEFWSSLINTEDVKAFIDMLNSVISVGSQIVSVFGAVPILVGVIAAVLTSSLVAAIIAIRRETGKLNVQLAITNTLTGYLPVLAGIITTLVVGLGAWALSAADTSKQIEKLNEKIVEQQKAIDELAQKEKDVTDLYKEYNSLMSKSKAFGLTTAEKESLLKISQDLVETYGLEVSGIDSVTGAYIVGANAINQYIEALRQERLEKEAEQTETRNDRISKNIDIAKSSISPDDIDGYLERAEKYYNMVNNIDPAKWDNQFIDDVWAETRKYELNDYMREFANNGGDIDSFRNHLYASANKYTSVVNSVVKDMLTNIQVDNADILDSNSESFMTQMLTPYLTTVDWDKFNKDDFEKRVSGFINGNKDIIDRLVKENANTNKAISSDKVSVDDYKKYIENETLRARMMSAITGDETQGKKVLDELANNFGAAMAEISNKLGESSGLFDTFTTNFLRLERELVQGTISFDKYIDGINSSLKDLDIKKTFGNNNDAIKNFFSSMQDKGKKVLENIAADFKAGKKPLADYISEVESVGEYFVGLGEKAATFMGKDSDSAKSIQSTSKELSTLLAELKTLQGVVKETSVTFEEFEKKPLSSIESLVNKLLNLGITVQDLGGDATDSAKDVAKSLKSDTEAFAKMQTALAMKTQSVLAQIGGSIGKIISGITNYVKNFKVRFDVDLNPFDGNGFGIDPNISGDVDVSKSDIQKYADSYAGIKRDSHGGVIGWTQEKQDKYDKALKADATEVYFGNLLSDSIDVDFLNSLIGKDFGNVVGNPPADTGTDKGKKAFDDKYYSAIKAWLEENKKEIEKLEKEQESLNRQFESALESGNKERAEILRAKLAENSNTQKDLLQQQNEAHRITKQNLLKSLYEEAPELTGKAWEEISEVDLVNIENKLSKEAEETETSKKNNNKDKAKLKLNTFKGIVEDLKEIDNTIKENSASWWEIDDEAKSYWDSQIDFQDEYSNKWIENQKAFDSLTEQEELDAYSRMINNNKEFQNQILNDTSLSEESKLELIKKTNDLIDKYTQEHYQKQKEMRWDDSNKWINNRNTYNDWNLFGDSEIDAWERVIRWLNEDYPKDLEKIEEAEKNLFEARKKEFNKANEFANAYLDSQKTILQSQYDVDNSIAEARHEINKELETSMTMYGYLEEKTRQLLFNQEDYNRLNEELNNIEDEALRLKLEYDSKLRTSTLETVESITSEYQMQYETLMKSYEIAKADLEIAKKKQKLNNVLNERNVRMFINGQWQWVANTQDVVNAKSELADAEYAKKVEEAGLTQQNSINELTKRQDELGVVIKQFENGVIGLDDAVRLAKKAIGSMPNALYASFSKITQSAPSVTSKNSSSSNKYDGVAEAYKANNYAEGIDAALANGDIDTALAANKLRNEKIDYLGLSEEKWTDEDIKKRANGHANGTRYTPGGLTLMGEEGSEMYITANGRLIPINQPTIGNIPSGGVVFNSDQMKNLRTLWDMSNFNLNADRSYVGKAQAQQIDQSQDNRIIINGMTVDSGSADGRALINALQRYVGNH